MSPAAQALRALSDHLQTGDELPEAERRLLCDGLERFFAGEDDLDGALGLKVDPGQRSVRTKIALDRRDELIRETAARFFPDECPAAQAAAIARYWKRYAASGWRRECALSEMPPARAGKLEGCLWRLMRIRAHPLSERTIREILKQAPPLKLAAS